MDSRYQTGRYNTGGANRGYNAKGANRSYSAYVDGNTVRRAEAVPKYEPRREPKRDPRREQQERKEQERKRRAKQAARVNQQRALRMNPGYVVFLSFAVLLTVGVCVVFLKLQAEVRHNMKEVATLESQILELKTDNDAALNKIECSVNLDTVKDIAINQMGMVYPAPDQIVYFQVDEDDYMNQYQDIPQR